MPRIKPKETEVGVGVGVTEPLVKEPQVTKAEPLKMGVANENESSSENENVVKGNKNKKNEAKNEKKPNTSGSNRGGGGGGGGGSGGKEESSEQASTGGSATSGAGKKPETVQLHQQPQQQYSLDMSDYLQCSNISTPMTKISCYVEHTIYNHPAVLFAGALTTLICTYIFCRCSRTLRRNRRWNRHGAARRRRSLDGTYSDAEMGEYAALAVYDELLDDFDKEDLSSAYTSGKDDDDDDDSIGTIISQWSESENNGVSGSNKRRSGTFKNGIVRKIELTAFDDGHLSLSEVNG